MGTPIKLILFAQLIDHVTGKHANDGDDDFVVAVQLAVRLFNAVYDSET